MSHINPRLGLVLTPASQSSASLQLCLHSRAASTLHHPHLLHPSECWRVRTGSGHDAAPARRRWRCVCPAHTGQVSSSATTTSCFVNCKFPSFRGSRGGGSPRGRKLGLKLKRLDSGEYVPRGGGRGSRWKLPHSFPQTMHIAGVCIRIYTPGTLLDANLQSWSVKSLLYFVVCFIVWTGEYHILAVDPPLCCS